MNPVIIISGHSFGIYMDEFLDICILFQIYPVLTPSQPGLPPRPLLPPTSPQEPSEEDDYDGIEKLDMKVDPNTETKKPENNEKDNDSVVVDAI